jgi:hypothetical protein
MHHRRICLVEHRVVYVARLEEKLLRTVDHSSIWQDVGYITRRDLTDSWSEMVVFTDVTTWLQDKFGNPQFVLAVQVGSEPLDRRFEFDLSDEPFGFDLDRAAAGLSHGAFRRSEQ